MQIIGVARGALGAGAPPGRRKFFMPNLQGKVVSAPPGRQSTLPPRQSKSPIFEEICSIWAKVKGRTELKFKFKFFSYA